MLQLARPAMLAQALHRSIDAPTPTLTPSSLRKTPRDPPPITSLTHPVRRSYIARTPQQDPHLARDLLPAKSENTSTWTLARASTIPPLLQSVIPLNPSRRVVFEFDQNEQLISPLSTTRYRQWTLPIMLGPGHHLALSLPLHPPPSFSELLRKLQHRAQHSAQSLLLLEDPQRPARHLRLLPPQPGNLAVRPLAQLRNLSVYHLIRLCLARNAGRSTPGRMSILLSQQVCL